MLITIHNLDGTTEEHTRVGWTAIVRALEERTEWCKNQIEHVRDCQKRGDYDSITVRVIDCECEIRYNRRLLRHYRQCGIV